KACPHCGHTKFVPCWTADGVDGSRTQHRICRHCSGRVKFALELPQNGESTVWPVDNSQHGT
ncbi:MAG: hypothetical protein M3552_15095, partial [Planctomycetota bacterium]|nr:hypothetical protein [Planctomycetota bacterium]